MKASAEIQTGREKQKREREKEKERLKSWIALAGLRRNLTPPWFWPVVLPHSAVPEAGIPTLEVMESHRHLDASDRKNP